MPRFETAPASLDAVETPVPIVDVAVAERNLARWQARCDAAGLANRPHIKTHKLVYWARRQVELGATGITCQKVGEAEAMADGGLDDILITFNILGESKLARLSALSRRAKLSVVADNAQTVAGLGAAARAAGRPLVVLVECDTGAGRCGVQDPAAARDLGSVIAATEGLVFGGLMTYPKAGGRAAMGAFLREAKALCEAAGLPVSTVSAGGTPDMAHDEGLDVVTEYRAGTYIYNDRSLVARGVCGLEDCALTVLATIVSRPAPGRAIIDAGSKGLTSDLVGLQGFGLVLGHPGASIVKIDEEHGYVELSGEAQALQVGDRLRIVPNHVCPVTNLYDSVLMVDGKRVLGRLPVEARGRVT